MPMNAYLRFVGFEFLLVAFASISLSYSLLNSFYVAPSLQYGPVPALMSLLLVALFFVAARDRRTAKIAVPLVVLACLAMFAVSILLSPGNFFEDTEESYFFATLACVIASVMCFVMSRWRIGSILLFAAGAFVCSGLQFFYERDDVVWSIVFICSALVLVIYKNYQLSVRSATSVRGLSFSAGFATACAAAAIAAGVALGVWFAVIAPLNPGVVDLKLITEVRALPTEEVQGTSSEQMVPIMDLTSDNTNNLERTTDNLVESDDGRLTPARPETSNPSVEQQSGSFLGIDINSLQEAFDIENNEEEARTNILLLILIPLLIAAYFVGRRIMRTRKLNKVRQLPAEDQVRTLYPFFIKKLSKLGFSVAPGTTLLEYSSGSGRSLWQFEEQSGVKFQNLTDAYVDVVYGGKSASQASVDEYSAFYRSLWKGARKVWGPVKYFFRSFVF